MVWSQCYVKNSAQQPIAGRNKEEGDWMWFWVDQDKEQDIPIQDMLSNYELSCLSWS